MFFTTAGGRDASDKYHKSRFQFLVFSRGAKMDDQGFSLEKLFKSVTQAFQPVQPEGA